MISSADKTLTYDELSKLVFKGILGDKTCEWAQVCMWERGIIDKRLLFCGLVCVCSYFHCLGPPQGLASCSTALMNHLLSGILYHHRWELLGLNDFAQRSWITSWLILGRVAGRGGDREPCGFKSQISAYPPCSYIPGRVHRHRRQLSSSMQVNSIMHLWWALKYHGRRHMVCPHRRPLCCCTIVWKMLRF